MKKLTHKQQLQIIEGLCLLYHNSSETFETAKSILEDVYKIAHLNSDCNVEHLDWHKSGIQLAKDLNKHGITKVEGIE